MLTEDAKVDSSSTRQLLPSSVNISAEYPALPDHDSMNNPSKLGSLSLHLLVSPINICSESGFSFARSLHRLFTYSFARVLSALGGM